MTRFQKVTLFIITLLIGAGGIGVSFYGLPTLNLSPSMQQLTTLLGAWPIAGPAVFVVLYAFSVILFVPGVFLAFVGGAAFGPVAGTIYVTLGSTGAALISFLIARHLFRKRVQSWIESETLRGVQKGIAEQGGRFVAFLRFLPALPYSLQNYLFGLTQIPLGTYVVVSFVCMIPGAFVNTYAGYAGRMVIVGGVGAGKLYTIVGTAVALLLLFAMLPTFIRTLNSDAS